MNSNHTSLGLGPKADKETVRRHNLSLVLRAVRDEGEAYEATAPVCRRPGGS